MTVNVAPRLVALGRGVRSPVRTPRQIVPWRMCAVAALVLTARPTAAQTPQHGWLGWSVHRDSAATIVRWIEFDSPAQHAGLMVGDTIVSFNNIKATDDVSGSRLRQLLTPGTRLSMRVRHESLRTVTVDVTLRTPAVFPIVGKPAPQLSVLQWLNSPVGTPMGPTTTFGDGHVYLVDFTADWCENCPAMYPLLDTLQQKYAKQGVRVLYVTALWNAPSAEDSVYQASALMDLRAYIKDHHLSYPMGVIATQNTLGASGYFNRTEKGNTIGLPRAVLIDGKGYIRAVMALDHQDRFIKAVDSVATASPPPTS